MGIEKKNIVIIATIIINNDTGKVHFAGRLLLIKEGFKIIALADYCPI